MAVVASWDGPTRRIHLAQGVTEFNPCADVYPEYREQRRLVEGFRRWFPFVEAIGNKPKGGEKYTPRYLLLLDDGDIGQTKIVPYDEDAVIEVTGELLCEDESNPFDFSSLSPGTTVVVNYAPPTSEIIQLGVSGLTDAESDALLAIEGDIASIQSDVSSINVGVSQMLSLLTGIEERDIGEHITNPETGKLEIVNDAAQRRWQADAWEDLGKSIPYRGEGLEVVGTIAEIAY